MALRTLRFALALTATNLKSSFALRGAFWLQGFAMLLNDIFLFSIWWIFFHRFEEIRGWRVDDMAALFGVVVGGYGIAVLFFGGVRDLSRLIIDGDLDSLLTQPKSPLLQALGYKTVASGWGELATSLLFLAISGKLTLGTVPLALVAVLVSGAVFTATGVLIHSLAFWLGRIETLARQLWEFTITFSIYPRPLFGGALKLLLFTHIQHLSEAALWGCAEAAPLHTHTSGIHRLPARRAATGVPVDGSRRRARGCVPLCRASAGRVRAWTAPLRVGESLRRAGLAARRYRPGESQRRFTG
jgi:ABC-2 type transport system permease protein